MRFSATSEPASPMPVAVGFAGALVLWAVMFNIDRCAFWPMMTAATALLGAWALVNEPTLRLPPRKLPRAVLTGASSALALYIIFLLGGLAVRRFPGLEKGVESVYSLREGAPTGWIGLSLLFPIAPGEELFWRGLVQGRLDRILGGYSAVAAAAVLYAAVHIVTLNPILVIAALVSGLFWGTLFRAARSIWPPIISHILWDLAVFILVPLRHPSA